MSCNKTCSNFIKYCVSFFVWLFKNQHGSLSSSAVLFWKASFTDLANQFKMNGWDLNYWIFVLIHNVTTNFYLYFLFIDSKYKDIFIESFIPRL